MFLPALFLRGLKCARTLEKWTTSKGSRSPLYATVSEVMWKRQLGSYMYTCRTLLIFGDDLEDVGCVVDNEIAAL